MPGIYTKLLDIDKVDLTVSGYATNMVVPALPVMIQNNRLFFGLFALGGQQPIPLPEILLDAGLRARPEKTFSKGYFDLAMAQTPKPKTLAIVARRRGVPPQCLRRRARECQGGTGSRSSMTASIRRRRSISRRSFAPCRRPTRTSSTSPPTRPTRSASFMRSTRSGSRPTCSAAPLSGCRPRR